MGLVRVEYPDREPEIVTHDPDRFREVRVIGDQDGNLEILEESVPKEMSCQVHIGTLLFCLVHKNLLRRIAAGQHHPQRVGQEMSKGNRQVGDGSQCSQIHLLIKGRGLVIWPGADAGREVLDGFDSVVRQHHLAELAEVKPLEGGPLQRAIVEVKAVDVNVSSRHLAVPVPTHSWFRRGIDIVGAKQLS